MGKIDLAVAKEMVNNYAETRKRLIDQAYGIDDTKSIWFSIEEVQNFVKSLSPDTSGVRIYLGVYNDDDPKTPDHTTVIAIETVRDATGVDVDSIGQQKLTEGGGSDPYNSGKICPPFC
jgi:hypothetical protein